MTENEAKKVLRGDILIYHCPRLHKKVKTSVIRKNSDGLILRFVFSHYFYTKDKFFKKYTDMQRYSYKSTKPKTYLKSKENNSLPKKCNCDILLLMQQGCKCKGI